MRSHSYPDLLGAETYARNLQIRLHHDAPFRRAMLELHIINIGAARSDPFEGYRFHRAKLSDGGLELWQLLAGNIGETRTHQLVFRLPEPELFDVSAQRSLRPRVLCLVLGPLDSCRSSIRDLLRLGFDPLEV